MATIDTTVPPLKVLVECFVFISYMTMNSTAVSALVWNWNTLPWETNPVSGQHKSNQVPRQTRLITFFGNNGYYCFTSKSISRMLCLHFLHEHDFFCRCISRTWWIQHTMIDNSSQSSVETCMREVIYTSPNKQFKTPYC